jgi:hypothetical protein
MSFERLTHQELKDLKKSQFPSTVIIDQNSGRVTGEFTGFQVLKTPVVLTGVAGGLIVEDASNNQLTQSVTETAFQDVPEGVIVPLRFNEIELEEGIIILFKG